MLLRVADKTAEIDFRVREKEYRPGVSILETGSWRIASRIHAQLLTNGFNANVRTAGNCELCYLLVVYGDKAGTKPPKQSAIDFCQSIARAYLNGIDEYSDIRLSMQ